MTTKLRLRRTWIILSLSEHLHDICFFCEYSLGVIKTETYFCWKISLFFTYIKKNICMSAYISRSVFVHVFFKSVSLLLWPLTALIHCTFWSLYCIAATCFVVGSWCGSTIVITAPLKVAVHTQFQHSRVSYRVVKLLPERGNLSFQCWEMTGMCYTANNVEFNNRIMPAAYSHTV